MRPIPRRGFLALFGGALAGCAVAPLAPAPIPSQRFDGPVHGHCRDDFSGVAQVFAERFAAGEETGAAIAIYYGGECVVDLWGGLADDTTERAWQRDTSALLMSSTKALPYISILMLAGRGELDLDAPVAQYWPEFAAHGKDRVTVRSLMAHRAGIPALDRPIGFDEIMAWEPLTDALAAQQPLWEPDTAHGYHPLTTGWALSEIVRRVDGRRAREFFAEEVAAPLGLNLSIGNLDPARDIARMIPPSPGAGAPGFEAFTQALSDPTSISLRAFTTPQLHQYDLNSVETQALEMPAGNGYGDARSLARLYASLVGEVNGIRLLTPARLADAIEPRSSGKDSVLLMRTDFASGFLLPGGPLYGAAPQGSFGHGGSGGSLGFGDPGHQLGFGYVMNRMSPGLGSNRKLAELVAAAYAALPGGHAA